MKKILISLPIILLLIGGYFVGQNQLTNHPTDSGYLSVANETNSQISSQSDTNNESSDQSDDINSSSKVAVAPQSAANTDGTDIACGPTNDCAPTTTDPTPVGNPLSKYIVKTGTVKIEIKRGSLIKEYDKIIGIIKTDGGYVEQDQSEVHSATVTVRIPSEKLDSELVNLRKLGKITSQSQQSSDQGYAVKDNEVRLSILQQRRDVLVASLAKANASDTASIQDQIFSVQSDIETIQGQEQLLNDQIAMSTLTITLTEKGQKSIDHNKGQKSLIGKSWEKASKSLLVSFGGIIIVIGATLPIIILILIVAYVAIAIIRNKKKDKK